MWINIKCFNYRYTFFYTNQYIQLFAINNNFACANKHWKFNIIQEKNSSSFPISSKITDKNKKNPHSLPSIFKSKRSHRFPFLNTYFIGHFYYVLPMQRDDFFYSTIIPPCFPWLYVHSTVLMRQTDVYQSVHVMLFN